MRKTLKVTNPLKTDLIIRLWSVYFLPHLTSHQQRSSIITFQYSGGFGSRLLLFFRFPLALQRLTLKALGKKPVLSITAILCPLGWLCPQAYLHSQHGYLHLEVSFLVIQERSWHLYWDLVTGMEIWRNVLHFDSVLGNFSLLPANPSYLCFWVHKTAEDFVQGILPICTDTHDPYLVPFCGKKMEHSRSGTFSCLALFLYCCSKKLKAWLNLFGFTVSTDYSDTYHNSSALSSSAELSTCS